MSSKKKNVPAKQKVNSLLAVSHYSGPLPDPNSLERYEQIVPGCAERLITLVEKQSQHRMIMERKCVNFEMVLNTIGLISGFIIALVTTIGPMFLIYKGYTWTSTLFTIPIGLTIAYLVTRKHKSK